MTCSVRPAPGWGTCHRRNRQECPQLGVGDAFGVSRFVFVNDSRFECSKVYCSFRILNFTSSFSFLKSRCSMGSARGERAGSVPCCSVR